MNIDTIGDIWLRFFNNEQFRIKNENEAVKERAAEDDHANKEAIVARSNAENDLEKAQSDYESSLKINEINLRRW